MRISLLYVSPVGHGIHKMHVAVVWHCYRPGISCPSLAGVILLHGNCGQLPIYTGRHPSLDRGGGGAFFSGYSQILGHPKRWRDSQTRTLVLINPRSELVADPVPDSNDNEANLY